MFEKAFENIATVEIASSSIHSNDIWMYTPDNKLGVTIECKDKK